MGVTREIHENSAPDWTAASNNSTGTRSLKSRMSFFFALIASLVPQANAATEVIKKRVPNSREESHRAEKPISTRKRQQGKKTTKARAQSAPGHPASRYEAAIRSLMRLSFPGSKPFEVCATDSAREKKHEEAIAPEVSTLVAIMRNGFFTNVVDSSVANRGRHD